MNARISLGEAEFVRELLDGIEADWWWKHSDFVLEGGGTAVYLEANNADITVIRQQCERGDRFVFIPPDQLQALIDRLEDLFGDD